jgi:transposase-like protein
MCSLTFDDLFVILSAVRPGQRLQRFRCLRCGRCYDALTGTPLARLRKKECWLTYLQCVLESRTVRESARVVGVHCTTSFRWRHRFVPGAMRGGVAKRRGINKEHDCLLVARDRSGQTVDFRTGRGQVTAAQFHRCLEPVLPADVLLISDGAISFRHFAAHVSITHESVNRKAGIWARGAIHIKNVNSWHCRFKSWLVRFRGVASRYLINYSG